MLNLKCFEISLAAPKVISLSCLARDRERVSEAARHFEKALKIRPDYSEAHFNVGVLLERLERVEGEVRDYGKRSACAPITP